MLIDSKEFIERTSKLGCPRDYFVKSSHILLSSNSNFNEIVNTGKKFYYRFMEVPGLIHIVISDDDYTSKHEEAYYTDLLAMIKTISH